MKKPVKTLLRDIVLNNSLSNHAWGALKERSLLAEYRTRREHYYGRCEAEGLRYDQTVTAQLVLERLTRRGYTPALRTFGTLHTFAMIPRIGWHSHLYDDLRELGPVSEFDYTRHGFDLGEFASATTTGLRRRWEMNQQFAKSVETAHRERPIDWIFVYANGVEILAETIRSIQETIGVPVVNMCLDDKQSWAGRWIGDQFSGQIDIAPAFDLSWTSARIACEWYLAEGGRPLYMPEGCNIMAYKPSGIKQDIPVSFIGAAYGFRLSTIQYLTRFGIPVETFGPGWRNGPVWGNRAVEVICRSRLNLGMGGIGYSEELTNVKTRDFEVPCTGGGLYITSYNSDLSQHFAIGEEIVCYRNRDELLELIRYYLGNPEMAREIARRARERCLQEHRWLHRYKHLCSVLGIL